jgi:hypothetical protein
VAKIIRSLISRQEHEMKALEMKMMKTVRGTEKYRDSRAIEKTAQGAS